MKFRTFATILLASLSLLTFAGYEQAAFAQSNSDLLGGQVPKYDGAPMPELDKQPMQDEVAEPSDGVKTDDEEEDESIIETDVTGEIKPIQDEYVPTTLDNLSKLYWALGMNKLEDQKAIDNYLLINECELYQRYFTNDFEWLKIREATRAKLKKDVVQFPVKFEILIPIEFGRYDTEKQEFEITPETKIVDMRKLGFSHNPPHRVVCGTAMDIYGYPRNIIVTLNRSFSMERVPVDPEIAEMFLEEARDRISLLPSSVQMSYYKRTAFLRLKVHITKYKESVHGGAGDMRAIMFASIDGVEVYADSHKMKPMYMSSVDSRRGVKFRRGGAMLRPGNIKGIDSPPQLPNKESIKDINNSGLSTNVEELPVQPKIQGDGTVDTSAGGNDYDTNYDHAPNESKPKPKEQEPAPLTDPQPAN